MTPRNQDRSGLGVTLLPLLLPLVISALSCQLQAQTGGPSRHA
jgi:hypothetical protein